MYLSKLINQNSTRPIWTWQRYMDWFGWPKSFTWKDLIQHEFIKKLGLNVHFIKPADQIKPYPNINYMNMSDSGWWNIFYKSPVWPPDDLTVCHSSQRFDCHREKKLLVPYFFINQDGRFYKELSFVRFFLVLFVISILTLIQWARKRMGSVLTLMHSRSIYYNICSYIFLVREAFSSERNWNIYKVKLNISTLSEEIEKLSMIDRGRLWPWEIRSNNLPLSATISHKWWVKLQRH